MSQAVKVSRTDESTVSKILHFLKLAFLGYFLDDTVDPVEKLLLKKVDLRLMPFSIICYWLKNMDSGAADDALNAGVSTQFGMYGGQRAYLASVYNAGYGIWQVPAVALLARLRPSRILPAFEFLWTVLTLIPMGFSELWHWYVYKFFMGSAAAITYPGIIYMLGSWYTKRELGKRIALFITLSGIGNTLKTYLELPMQFAWGWWPGWGGAGLSVWQWYLLVPALLSFVMASLGLLTLPDYPINTKWLSEDERRHAIDRLEREGRTTTVDKFTWAMVRRTLGRPEFYILVIMFSAFNLTAFAWGITGAIGFLNPGNTVLSVWTSTVFVPLQWIVPLLGTTLSDLFQNRVWFIVIPNFIAIVGCIFCMTYNPTPENVLSYLPVHLLFNVGHSFTLGSPLSMAWANEAMKDNNQARGFTISIMNTLKTLINIAPVPISFYQNGPKWVAFHGLCIAYWTVGSLSAVVMDRYEKRQNRLRLADLGGQEEVVDVSEKELKV